MKVIAIIPAYNEETTVAGVVAAARPFVSEVFVVNDGSTDATAARAFGAGAVVYTHRLNRGLGASLATGIKAALEHGADVLVTLDADGQHNPAEISKFVEAINTRHVQAVIGSRILQGEGMPFIRQLYNWVGNLLTYMLFGLWVTDSQSGFRAFTREGARKLDLRCNRMEVSSEIIKEIHDKQIPFCEIPCSVSYTEYSMSKGQGFFVGIATVCKLLVRRFGK